jgi:hypothetical protein
MFEKKKPQPQTVELEVEISKSLLDEVLENGVVESPKDEKKITAAPVQNPKAPKQVVEIKRQKSVGGGWQTVEVLHMDAAGGTITIPAPKEGERYAVFAGPKPKPVIKPCGCGSTKVKKI